MNNLTKISLAALGGITVLMLAAPADAAIKRSKFNASVDEIRRYCERIDQDFWLAKRSYGCGVKIGCTSGSCRVYTPPPPPPPPTYPTPRLLTRDGGGNGSDGGKKGGGNDNGGGGQGSSSSGPN